MKKMIQSEFETFIDISMKDHMRSQILAGNWTEENAPGNMENMRRQIIPDYLDTTGHYFFSIHDERGEVAGGLWFAVRNGGSSQFMFVVDIQVYQGFRRKGFGTAAFQFMEQEARVMGINVIHLNVFDHNKPARAMYEKLGYIGEAELMSKELSS